MTQLLARALAEVAQLPRGEQDAVAALILAELDAESRWAAVFQASPGQLAALAEEAFDDYRRGKTQSIKFLVGQVMRMSKGQANPQIVERALAEELGATAPSE